MKRTLLLLVVPLLALGGEGVWRRGRPETGKKSTTVLALLPTPIDSAFIASDVALTGTHGEAVTTTRASSKFCTKADGTLVSLGNHTPCVETNGLLVEASHTNVLLYSNLSGSGWASVADGVATAALANAATAPDGTNTATRIAYSEAVPPKGYDVWQASPAISPGTYTASVYLKAGTTSAVNLRMAVSGGSGSAGTACSLTTSWQRCTTTFTAGTGATSVNYRIGNDGLGPTGLVAGTIFAWGAQLETGAYAHSYVATTGTGATSAADVVSMSGSKLPTSTGNVFIDYVPLWTTPNRPADALLFDSTASRTKGVALDISYGTPTIFIGATVLSDAELTWTAGQKYTVRVAWGGGTVSGYRNGTLWKSGAASSPTSHGTLYLGSYSGGGVQADGWLSNLKVTK